MKKILYAGIVMLLFTTAASAQKAPAEKQLKTRVSQGFQSGDIHRIERQQLHKDVRRQQIVKHKSPKDAVVNKHERRRMHRTKAKTRHDAFRFKNNRRHRIS